MCPNKFLDRIKSQHAWLAFIPARCEKWPIDLVFVDSVVSCGP